MNSKITSVKNVETVAIINKILDAFDHCEHPHPSFERNIWCNLCGAINVDGTWIKPHWLDIISKIKTLYEQV